MKIYLHQIKEQYKNHIKSNLKLNFDENGLYFETDPKEEYVKIGTKILLEGNEHILCQVRDLISLVNLKTGGFWNSISTKELIIYKFDYISYKDLKDLIGNYNFSIISTGE